MIQFKNIEKSFHQKKQKHLLKALDKVSFDCENGKITALLGPNGAGKTTLIKILAGLLNADKGSISLTDSKQSLGFFIDGFGLYPKLSVYENIQYFADLNDCNELTFKRQFEKLDASLNLARLVDKRADTLSQGERMRVGLARALIHNPHYIILDEPTNGLDVMSTIELRTFLKQLTLVENGSKCILYASHVMAEVEKLADDIIILQHGKIMTQGTCPAIKTNTQSNDLETAFLKLVEEAS